MEGAEKLIVKLHNAVGSAEVSRNVFRKYLGELGEEFVTGDEVRIDNVLSDECMRIADAWVEQEKAADPNYEAPDFSLFVVVEGIKTSEYARRFLERAEIVESVDYGRVDQGLDYDGSNCGGVGQTYLEEAPLGIGARYAWQFRGGAGRGVRLVDVERGWVLAVDDLRGVPIRLLDGSINSLDGHGTKVLGIVAANNDGVGITGIAHELELVGLSSMLRKPSGHESVADAVVKGGVELRSGDVMLTEVFWAQNGQEPIESRKDIFELIKLLSRRGICVIEPAGNGNDKLNIKKDSGGILVGDVEPFSAGQHAYQVSGTSNFGDRVDAYALGRCIRSVGSMGLSYFSNTSGSAAIVAGVVANIQGISKENLGRVLLPAEIRVVLRTFGGEVRKGKKVQQGRVPDLREIIENRLGVDFSGRI